MIELLPPWRFADGEPCFYDTDTVSMIELGAKLQGAMNNLIENYNQFIEQVNRQIIEMNNTMTNSHNVHESAMRQEYQDFIDIVSLKISELEKRIKELEKKG